MAHDAFHLEPASALFRLGVLRIESLAILVPHGLNLFLELGSVALFAALSYRLVQVTFLD